MINAWHATSKMLGNLPANYHEVLHKAMCCSKMLTSAIHIYDTIVFYVCIERQTRNQENYKSVSALLDLPAGRRART